MISPKVSLAQKPDLENGSGALTADGQTIASAPANAGMGHCFNVLAWLANRLGKDGKPLTNGTLVMTGSIVAAYFPQPGQTLGCNIAGMGEIGLKIN